MPICSLFFEKVKFMSDKPNDRRTRKTQKALREGLSLLMAEKNIKDISVRELTELVDLNRGTFYLHYKDVYDLQQQIENDIVLEITGMLDKYLPGNEKGRPYKLFVALLNYIEENANICRMLLSSNSGRTFMDKLCDLVETKCMQNLLSNMELQASPDELLYFSSFAVAGYIATISKWLECNMQIPTQELALLMEKMGLQGIGVFEKHA
jgi:AcrR family transcriptional regulator